ncbi:hypothetical protein [Nonomuraea polychroma]|uniref:hypothetical protein n=1 Tax=Nonomuraea polychroma TaxID=46176 RepID=UPI000FDEA9B4|nr:hypothetical protein [Nonomuraea polychroma]
MGLYVEGPSTPTQKVADGGANQTISGTFDAGNAPNGTFTVTLKGELTGTSYATSTFKLRRPAETPSNVAARLQGTKKILVTWSKGSEPDLQSYELANSRSGVVGRLPVDSACAGGTCEAAVAVPANAAGQKVGFTVKAFRGDGDGGSIGSDASGPAVVTIPAPPAAQPKKKTAKTRETPKGTRNVDPLPTLPAKKQTLPTNKPTTRKPTTSQLPAIPDTDADGNLPIPTADGQSETGGLTPAGTKEDGTDAAPVQAGGVKAQSDESPIGSLGQYGLYIVGGLLLLLRGAHAGAWARRRALAAEGTRRLQSPAAMASRTAAGSGGAGEPAADAVRGDDDGAPLTSTPPRRRPAVILAVAKTRVPDHSAASKVPSADLSGAKADLPRGRATSSVASTGAQDRSSAGRFPAISASSVDRLEAVDVDRLEAVEIHRPEAVDVDRLKAGEVDRPETGESDRLDVGQVEASSSGSRRAQGSSPADRAEELPQAVLLRKESPAAGVPSDGGEVLAGETGAADEGHVSCQEPVRIALPSSAVTEVPEASVSVLHTDIRIEDRWDDYLPPSPRSMEDSGFWERPQPGAADFWAADDDDDDHAGDDGDDDKRVYAVRRHKGSHS